MSVMWKSVKVVRKGLRNSIPATTIVPANLVHAGSSTGRNPSSPRLPSSVYNNRREGETKGFIYVTRSNLEGGLKLPPSHVAGATCYSSKDTRV